MKQTAPAIVCLAAGLALAGVLAACSRGTLGDGAGPIGHVTGMGAGAGGGMSGGAGGVTGPSMSGRGGVFGDGVGGSGGSGSRGGTPAGRGGSGGGLVPCPPPDPPVCGSLCGNGRVDSCVRGRSPECFPYMMTEECDLTDFGTLSADCRDLGYGSGGLACDGTCRTDASGCSDCLPGVPSVLACGIAPTIGLPYPGAFAVAATDSEVGLAMISYAYDGRQMLSFQRFSANLDVASNLTLVDTGQPGPLADTFFEGVGVAPLASGWAVATCVASRLYVYVVDATGLAARGAATTQTLAPEFACSADVLLIARPGGGAMMIWYTSAGLAEAMLGADGVVGTAQHFLSDSFSSTGQFHAAWVGDAFQFAMPVYPPPTYDLVLRLTRIDVSGGLSSRDLLQNEIIDAPGIALGAADLRITYLGPIDGYLYPGVKLARIGPTGAVLAAVGPSDPGYIQLSPAVAVGDDTVVLLGSRGSLSLTRLGPDGQMVRAPYDIAQSPPGYIWGYDMVPSGPDVIVSWTSQGATGNRRIGLARVRP